ncbi:hypothetical protein SCLCIDRAFT_1220630 [Scleroderma citrinum Foug A]|uniref:Uncharacterized protein n=1 Tax=Scleroderma citrinum Foug A TaxID=1036808 RepID=A0A0C3D5A6_9AGAM|nr:hypothetical protein SCLCIDRAFT_1220630 [Scleroderma citrinum Foug A]
MRKETSQLMAILTPQLSPQEFHSPDLNVLKALLHSTNPWYSLGTRQRHVSPMTTPVVLCTTSTNLIKAFNHRLSFPRLSRYRNSPNKGQKRTMCLNRNQET